MNVLVVYATNSGGTAAAAQMIAKTLSGHTVTVKEAKDAGASDVTSAPALILGSPSWDYNGMEGQPLPEMIEFINRCKDVNLDGKLCAIFGLGDRSYTYFCGAVTYLEAFVKRAKGTLVVASLTVDGFYMKPDVEEQITRWAQDFSTAVGLPTSGTAATDSQSAPSADNWALS